MTDAYIQVATDGTGKKIDVSELTRSSLDASGNPVVVERQRFTLASDSDPTITAAVNPKGELSVSADFTEVLVQLKRIALLLEILTDTQVSAKDIR